MTQSTDQRPLDDPRESALLRLYRDPADYVDSDHPDVIAFADRAAPDNASSRTIASLLYLAVRDGVRYQPYVDMGDPETFRASSVLAAGFGYCVGKAALYAAALRAKNIPARIGFADVRNHLTTDKLRGNMATDLFRWHGFTEAFVEGAWRKATPTFNATLCAKLGVPPLDFNGLDDALLHAFDGQGRSYMRYETEHGAFYDVPTKFLMREMARCYPGMSADKTAQRDMEREARAQAL